MRLLLALLLSGCLSSYDTRRAASHCDVDAGVAVPGSCAPDGGVELHRNLGGVVFLGDSTTVGSLLNGAGFIESGGYRVEVYRLAQAYGVTYHTVGTLTNGPSTTVLPDRWRKHEGRDGTETRQMLLPTGLPTWLNQFDQAYSTVLIIAGIVDVNRAHQADVCTGDMGCVPGAITDPAYEIDRIGDRVVALARLFYEGCHFDCRVVIGTMTTITNKQSAIALARQRIKDAAAASPERFEVCEVGENVPVSGISTDNLHPNAFGYVAMGQAAARCLIGSLP